MRVCWQWSHHSTASPMAAVRQASMAASGATDAGARNAPVGGAVLSKDVGQLQSWLGHAGPPGCGLGLGSGLAAEALSGLQLVQT